MSLKKFLLKFQEPNKFQTPTDHVFGTSILVLGAYLDLGSCILEFNKQ
jgi:hypothetical protein